MIRKRRLMLVGVAVLLPLVFFTINYSKANKATSEKSMLEEKTQVTTKVNYQFPPIEHWTTENGARVYFVQTAALPMIDIEVVFDAGSARNGDKGGLSVLTNALLAEGTKNYTADEIHERFEAVGAEFENDAQRDMAYVRLRSLIDSKYFDQALSTMIEVLSSPTFPQEAFDRERNNALIALRQDEQSPGRIASKAFYQLIYNDEPYAAPVLGTKDSLAALTPKDLQAFYQQYYVAKNAVIAMVGDVTLEEAKKIAEKLTADLPAGQAAPSLPPVQDLTKGTMKKINFPSEQTHILVGMPGLKRMDPDYFPLVVGNHILGANGSVNRLFQTIRNEHGLAYDARSYFIPMRERGPYVFGLQTQKNAAQEALKLLDQTVTDFVTNGPSETELKMAKENLLGGYALRFDSNEALCGNLATIGFYNLPLNYFDEYPQKVAAVTLPEIKAAFKKRVHPTKLATVMVGQT